MERRVRGNSHARCEAGEKLEITSNAYLSLYLEVGDMLFHICEFAERMEQNGSTVIPLRSDLPELCYGVHGETGAIIVLKKGERGFYDPEISSKDRAESSEIVDQYNKKLGITKAQAAAMYWGSVYGFDTPGADPKQYDADGNMIKPQRKDRDAR